MAKTWFSITAQAGSNSVEIDLTDEIGAYGITTQIFLDALRPHAGKDVTFNVDCPGGSCEDGLSIYDAIGQFTGKVTMNIIGTAASMASVIILAAEERIISANGRIMIHRVSAGARGNPDQLQAATDVARQFEERIIGIYREKLSITEDVIRDKMKTEIGTWFFGEQAVQAGFATRTNTKSKARAFKAEWSPLFTMLPAALFDTREKETPTAPTPEIIMNKAILALASLAGVALKGDETEDQICTAIAAFKPEAARFEMNLDDPETKKIFDTAVGSGIAAALPGAVSAATKPLEEQITKLTALVTNGAAGAAQGAGATGGASGQQGGSGSSLLDQYNAITAPKDRAKFFAQHKEELLNA